MKRKSHEMDTKRELPPVTCPEVLCEEAWKVLVLGDGNLTYSLTLAMALPKAELWCTTLDSREELDEKYTECHATIRRLQALAPRVHVLHEVDALVISESLAVAEQAGAGPFHHIIFNHPHTGFECVKRHQALCAHFLER